MCLQNLRTDLPDSSGVLADFNVFEAYPAGTPTLTFMPRRERRLHREVGVLRPLCFTIVGGNEFILDAMTCSHRMTLAYCSHTAKNRNH